MYNGSSRRAHVSLLTFLLFFSTRDLRAPSTDRRETLPRYRKVLLFDKLGLKVWGALPKKAGGKKRPKFGSISGPLQSSIANISATDRDIQNRKDI